jgi:formylglycine-generating enzyme required for sulfatase activity/PKD repeat protein
MFSGRRVRRTVALLVSTVLYLSSTAGSTTAGVARAPLFRPAASTLSGRVTDAAGNPVSGVQISAQAIQGPALAVVPYTLPADNATAAALTLSGATANHRVRLSSSLPGVRFTPADTAVTDGNGVLTAQVRSTTAGSAMITARDLTAGRDLATSAEVTFSRVGSAPVVPPGPKGAIQITAVNAQAPLDSRFLEGVPAPNRIDVAVDWYAQTPGRVDFVLNGRAYSVAATASGAARAFDMGRDLRPGWNEIRITAYAAAGAVSSTRLYRIFVLARPIWMAILQAEYALGMFVLDGPIGVASEYKTNFEIPADGLKWDSPFGPPGSKVSLGFVVGGSARLGIRCEDPVVLRGTVGVRPKLDLLGVVLGGELKATGEVRGGATRCEIPSADGTLRVDLKVYGQKNWPVLTFVIDIIAPGAGSTIETVTRAVGLYDIMNALGYLYFRAGLTGYVASRYALHIMEPHAVWQDAHLAEGPEFEGGYMYSHLGKFNVFLRASGRIVWQMSEPRLSLSGLAFDSVGVTGEAGWELKPPLLPCSYAESYSLEWTSSPAKAKINKTLARNCGLPWQWSASELAPTVFHPRSTAWRGQSGSDAGPRPAGLSATSPVTAVLATNAYTYTEPSVAFRPARDQAILTWVHADKTKAPGEALEIRASRWDGSAWSTPIDLTDDELIDGMPRVAWTSETTAVAVWSRLDRVLATGATWDQATASRTEIASATYSTVTDRWSAVSLLTDDDALDLGPVVAPDGDGGLIAAWHRNAAGATGASGAEPDSIRVAHWPGGTWDAPQTVVDGLTGLGDIAVARRSGQAVLAWTAPISPTGGVSVTPQVFYSLHDGTRWGDPVRLTDTREPNARVRIAYVQDEPCAVWLSGGVLTLQPIAGARVLAVGSADLRRALSSGEAVHLQGGLQLDEFDLAQDDHGNLMAVFTGQRDGQRDLFLAYFDAALGMWGAPQALTDDPASEDYPAVGVDRDGRLLMAYSRTVVSESERTATSVTGRTTAYSVPVRGRTDLCTLAHSPRRDVAVRSVDVSDPSPRPGAAVLVRALVANVGDVPLAGLSVAFGDNGATFASPVVPGALVAGEVVTVTANYIVPGSGGPRVLSANADPGNQIAEIDETNNRGTLIAFGPDLSVDAVAVVHRGADAVDLVSVVSNKGTTVSPSVAIRVHRDTVTGMAVVSDTVPVLAAASSITVTTPWHFGALPSGSHPLVAGVNEEAASFPETDTGNNVFTTTLFTGPDLMLSPLYVSTTSLLDAAVTITATVFNVGTTSADGVSVAFFRRPGADPASIIHTGTADHLAPGAFVTLVAHVQGPLGCGVSIVADPDQTIAEVSREDNVAYVAAPDGRCAAFGQSPLAGIAPLTVAFNDTSAGTNQGWLWGFGDGTTSTERNPSHIYAARGAYTVSLTVSGTGGSDRVTVPDAVRVYAPVHAAFVAAPLRGLAPIAVAFTDQSTGDITSWLWDFGDGDESVERSPGHTYLAGGTYTVGLTVAGPGGTDLATRSGYVVVDAPSPTPTQTPTATATRTPTATRTASATATTTPTPTLTSTATASSTRTTEITATTTPGANVTVTATTTGTPTSTPTTTATLDPSPSATGIVSVTPTPAATAQTTRCYLPLVGRHVVLHAAAEGAPGVVPPVEEARADVAGKDAVLAYAAVTGADGTYTIPGLPAGTFAVVAQKAGMDFVPTLRRVAVPPDTGGVDFEYVGEITVPGKMVRVGAGTFQMGSGPDDMYHWQDQRPRHTVNLNAFDIDKYEVTNARYAACVAAGACNAPWSTMSGSRSDYYGNATYADYPVVAVTWQQAVAFCTWDGKRLPTEAEWEKVARGPLDTRAFPWGNAAPDCTRANFAPGSNACVGDTNAVGSYPAGASPYGAMDMAGNVSEWTNDVYGSDYYCTGPGADTEPPYGHYCDYTQAPYVSPWLSPAGPPSGSARVARGEYFYSDTPEITVFRRMHYPISAGSYTRYLGFRCAR